MSQKVSERLYDGQAQYNDPRPWTDQHHSGIRGRMHQIREGRFEDRPETAALG